LPALLIYLKEENMNKPNDEKGTDIGPVVIITLGIVAILVVLKFLIG
jgi:hypothetical protein